MDIFQIVLLCIIATIFSVIVKVYKPEFGIQISIIAGIVVFIIIAGKISDIIELLKSYTARINIDMSYIKILLKIIGIAYISEFGAEICKDAGETSIASKIELAGKVIIMVMAIPILTSLLDFIINIMP